MSELPVIAIDTGGETSFTYRPVLHHMRGWIYRLSEEQLRKLGIARIADPDFCPGCGSEEVRHV